MVPAPTAFYKSLESFGPVEETAHVGTTFPSDSVQLSAFLTAPNADELIHDLATLVSNRGVVFFKNQDLTIQQQKQLALRLGELTTRPVESSLHRHPVSEDTPELGADTSVISSMGCVASCLFCLARSNMYTVVSPVLALYLISVQVTDGTPISPLNPYRRIMQ